MNGKRCVMKSISNGLEFKEEGHEYYLYGKRIPAVSDCLKPISNMVYGSAPKYILERAAQKGSDIHSLCEAYIKFGYVPAEHEYLGYVQAFQKWHNDKQIEIVASEIKSYHRSTAYAGTIDLLGKHSLHDIKTGKQAHEPLWKLQMSAYLLMLYSHGLTDIKEASIIQLFEDGNYQEFVFSYEELLIGYEFFKHSMELSKQEWS